MNTKTGSHFMLRTLLIGSIFLLSACSVEPGTAKWCSSKKEQAKSEWSGSDAATYAQNCLFDGSAVGSKNWCADLSAKAKGEWTLNEAENYAKNSLM
jgi:hypothetical protein